MEDRLLKFVTLIHAGNYSTAARLNNISQPALSMAIQQLEKELGEKLVIRSQGKLQLTPAGSAAYTAGLEIRGSIRTLKTALQQTQQNQLVYRIGSIDSIASSLFSDRSFFGQLQSLGEVQLTVDSTQRLLSLLNTGDIDIAIAAQSDIRYPTIVPSQSLFKERIVLVCAPELETAYQEQITNNEIYDVIAYNASSHTFKEIAKQLKVLHMTQHIRMHSTNPETMLRMTEQGLGATFLPYSTVSESLHHNTVVALEIPQITRPISIYTSALIYTPQLHKLIDEGLHTILELR